MFTLTSHNNIDAVLIQLLRKLKINISPHSVIAELEKHPDYPRLLFRVTIFSLLVVLARAVVQL